MQAGGPVRPLILPGMARSSFSTPPASERTRGGSPALPPSCGKVFVSPLRPSAKQACFGSFCTLSLHKV